MPERKASMDTLGVVLLVSFSVILGLNQALVKIVNTGYSPLFQGGLRSTLAFLPVLLFAVAMRRRLEFTRATLPWGILNGVFFTLEFGLLFVALDLTTVARASLFFYMMPVWVAVAAHFLIPEEPLTRDKLLGLTLAVAGIAIAMGSDLGPAGEDAWLGDLLALLAGGFWAGIALLTRLRLGSITAEMTLLYQLVVSGLLLTVLAKLTGDTVREPTITIYAIFSFQVIVVVAAGFLLWFWILSIYPTSNVASFSLLTPVFGILFGYLVFADPLTPAFMIAVVMAAGGIVLINRQPR